MRGFIVLVVAAVAAGVVVAGCGQTPAPAPTKAPAAPTQAAAPTKAAAPQPAAAPTTAPAPQPTAAPVKKLDWPQKGKTITIIVPIAAGGPTDVLARLLAPMVEKDLGTNVEVVNRVGGGSQLGLTELTRAKPDGYTFAAMTLPTALSVYLDPARGAEFGRKDIQPLLATVVEPLTFTVRADSPFKTLKDLVDAAKANPEKVKVGTGMFQSTPHLGALLAAQSMGVKFAIVNFDGNAPTKTALLGGHIDASLHGPSEIVANMKSGDLRALGIMDKSESKYLPGVKTLEAQGYPVSLATTQAMIAPAGTPREILDLYSGSIKKAMDSDYMKEKMTGMSFPQSFMGVDQFTAYWDNAEKTVKPLLELAAVK